MSGWRDFGGINEGYALELYERFLQDPHSVDPSTRAAFERLGPPQPQHRSTQHRSTQHRSTQHLGTQHRTTQHLGTQHRTQHPAPSTQHLASSVFGCRGQFG